MNLKNIKTRRKQKWHAYESSWKNNTKKKSGNRHRFRRGSSKAFGQNPTERARISGIKKTRWTEKSSVDTSDTHRIGIDVTNLDFEIQEREAAKPRWPKPTEPMNGRRPIVKMILR
jgi:hypothetical protein